MLDTYWGEFLVSPSPLELSLNYCSHKCAYCFANLNQPDRKADIKRIMLLLKHYHERKSVASMLMREGYPVVVSNRVDPFAHSNYRVFLPLLEMMTAQGFQVVMQTKGGRGVEDALALLKPSVWYVSIAFEDDAKRQSIEPGTPSLAERYDLIATLRAAGHTVVVGVNPLVPEWLPDPEPLLRRLHALDVWGVWIERLHFNHKQIGKMSDSERAAMGEDVIARARKRIAQPDFDHFLRTRQLAADIGLEVFSKNQGTPSAFFAPWYEVYSKAFPTLQDFVNLCHLALPDGGLVTFDDWLEFLAPELPAGVHGIDSYLGSTARNLWRTHTVPTEMTYSQLLALIWQDGRIAENPARSPAFAFAKVGEAALVDDREMPVMVFEPQGTGEWWLDVEAMT